MSPAVQNPPNDTAYFCPKNYKIHPWMPRLQKVAIGLSNITTRMRGMLGTACTARSRYDRGGKQYGDARALQVPVVECRAVQCALRQMCTACRPCICAGCTRQFNNDADICLTAVSALIPSSLKPSSRDPAGSTDLESLYSALCCSHIVSIHFCMPSPC